MRLRSRARATAQAGSSSMLTTLDSLTMSNKWWMHAGVGEPEVSASAEATSCKHAAASANL